MADDTLYLASTNVIKVSRLKDRVTGDYLDNATLTAALFDADGSPVSGAEDIAFTFTAGVGSAPGHYYGAIPHTVALVAGDTYDLRVRAIAADESERLFRMDLTAKNG